MLDTFYTQVGPEPINVPKSRGMTFYQVDDAGLARRARGAARQGAPAHRRGVPEPPRPQVVPARRVPVRRRRSSIRPRLASSWRRRRRRLGQLHVLGAGRTASSRASQIPAALQGYETYRARACMPGPICTPSLAVDRGGAARRTRRTATCSSWPSTTARTRHAFAKTQAEHEKNLKKYGYISDLRAAVHPADFAPPPTPCRPCALGARRTGSARPGPPRPRFERGSLQRRRRRVLRRPARAHALPDRASPSMTARRRTPATPASSSSGGEEVRPVRRQPLHDPGDAAGAGARIADVYGDLAGPLAGARRLARVRGASRVEADVRQQGDLGPARGRGAGRRARPGRGLGRGGPGDQGAGRARAGRGRVRGRRSGARRAPAGDPRRA